MYQSKRQYSLRFVKRQLKNGATHEFDVKQDDDWTYFEITFMQNSIDPNTFRSDSRKEFAYQMDMLSDWIRIDDTTQ